MSELIFCNRPMKSDHLSQICKINADMIHDKEGGDTQALSAYKPYLFAEDMSALDSQLMTSLSRPSVAKELTNMSLSFGGNNTLALAEITARLQELGLNSIGAATSVYSNRLNSFAEAVKKYQGALLAYRDSSKAKLPSRAMAKQRALLAFQELQFHFKQELKAVNAGINARRGTPLTSATRATNIAKDSRNVASLNLTTQTQTHNLVKFTNHAKFLGNGLAVIDFGSRVGNIRNEYRTGGDWERELFIESTSFAASAIVGTLAVNAGVAALGLLVVATPVGWVGLVVGGLAVAGTAAATSIAINNYTKNNSGNVYDNILNWLNG